MTEATAGAGHAPRWTIHTGRPRQRLQPRLTPLLILLGASWLLVILDHMPGSGHQSTHHHPQPGLASLLTVVTAWQLMTLAMMGPSCLPAARYVAMNTLRPARTVPAFLLGYLLPWSGLLAALAVGDAIAQGLTSHDGWLARHDTVPLAATLLAAAAWQLTPLKRAYLRGCYAGRVLPASGYRADLGAARFGTRHGLACLGSCGSMMSIMLTVESWHLLWMVGLGTITWLEKVRGFGRRLAYPTAAGFAVLAALTFLSN
jgi:predicted metal-binding membrane protein